MIEKMVLFENQKQLEETRDELERCKRFSFRLYAKELPLELTLSHEENNEVNAVKAILKIWKRETGQCCIILECIVKAIAIRPRYFKPMQLDV